MASKTCELRFEIRGCRARRTEAGSATPSQCILHLAPLALITDMHNISSVSKPHVSSGPEPDLYP
jgi:hypothetical protein